MLKLRKSYSSEKTNFPERPTTIEIILQHIGYILGSHRLAMNPSNPDQNLMGIHLKIWPRIPPIHIGYIVDLKGFYSREVNVETVSS